ncbi:MAG: hypothetical protein JWM21_3749 [Acidobacteria bacterium]|nr:hypothetical protein [Acidobacteriota bacterium]
MVIPQTQSCAPVAQWLEQQTHNLLVRGSNPCGGIKAEGRRQAAGGSKQKAVSRRQEADGSRQEMGHHCRLFAHNAFPVMPLEPTPTQLYFRQDRHVRNESVDFLPGALHMRRIKASFSSLANRVELAMVGGPDLSENFSNLNFVEADSMVS